MRKRTFVVASKALAAIPTWIRVSDVFNPKKGDWALLRPLGLQPDDPLYEKYSQRLQKLRAIQQYQYVMHVLDRKLLYEEVAEIFVRVNSLGVKLRSSDLAMAQVTARWQNSLRLFEEFGEELDNKSWFTLDTGLLVRTMVVFATGQSRFKTVQNISVPKMKSSWETAKESLHFAINFLKANCGIEDESLLTNPSLVIALAAFGAARKQKLSKADTEKLRQWTLIANARARYSRGSAETFLDQDPSVISKSGSLDVSQAAVGQTSRRARRFCRPWREKPAISGDLSRLEAKRRQGLGQRPRPVADASGEDALHRVSPHLPKVVAGQAGLREGRDQRDCELRVHQRPSRSGDHEQGTEEVPS